MTNPTLPTAGVAELLARVEAATGPDRELDHRIFMTTAPLEQFSYWSPADPLNHYTASLDAALALCERVLPGWTWDIGSEVDAHGATYFTAIMWGTRAQGDSGEHLAKTPALALLCALLKAKAKLSGAA